MILALDLYFDCKGKIPGPTDRRVKALSKLLRAFPHHSAAARKGFFRNPDGVAFKLQNLRQVATGTGLGDASRTDRQVWDELGQDPERTHRLATLIRAGIAVVESAADDPASDDVFAEGKVVTETHVRRERNPRLRKRLLEQRREQGGLRCDVCGLMASGHSPNLGEAVFEAHHVVPLAAGQERKTLLKDMSLVCANCHRTIHRAIAQTESWMSIEEARAAILGKAGT